MSNARRLSKILSNSANNFGKLLVFGSEGIVWQENDSYGQANTATNLSTTAYDQANTATTNAANATFLSTGIVSTARLGSGVANSATYLAGDNTWKPINLTNIPNSSLANSTFTIGSTSVSLGGTTNSFAGVTLTSPTFTSPALGTPASGNLANCTFPTLNQNTTGTASNITAYTINQSVGSSNSVQFNSLGVGTASSGTAGEIRATNNITAYYSDDRLKTKLGNIENALEKIKNLQGFYYEANELAQSLGYSPIREVGLSAQETQKSMPEIVKPAPIDDKYLTIQYERYAPYIIEAIKELSLEIEGIKKRLEM